MTPTDAAEKNIWSDDIKVTALLAGICLVLFVTRRPTAPIASFAEVGLRVVFLAPLLIFLAWKIRKPALVAGASILPFAWQAAEDTLNRTPNPPGFVHYPTAGKVLVIMLTVVAVAWIGRGRWTQYGITLRFRQGTVTRALIIVLGVVIFEIALAFLLVKTGIVSHQELQRQSAVGKMPLWQAALFQFVLVGIAEEFANRGFLQTHIDRLFGTTIRIWDAELGWGFLITALLFTAAHMLEARTWPLHFIWMPEQFVFIFPFSLLVGYLRAYTGTLVPAILVHGMWDGMGDVVLPYLFLHSII